MIFMAKIKFSIFVFSDLTISLKGTSEFPGQTGGNNNNFHFEDVLSKLTHISVGLLKEKIHSEN